MVEIIIIYCIWRIWQFLKRIKERKSDKVLELALEKIVREKMAEEKEEERLKNSYTIDE